MKAILSTEAKYEGVIIQKVFPLPLTDAVGSVVAAGPGDRVGELMPLYVCGALTKLTGLAGRRFRGRAYIPFPLEIDNTSVVRPTVAYVTLLNALATFAAIPRVVGVLPNTITVQPVIFHKPPPVVVPNFNHITTVTANPYWTSQRRRSNVFRSDTIPDIPV